jgi:hypothetical protein
LTNYKNQGFWAPGWPIVHSPPRMRLAPAECERLWKGLERFVNCGDDLGDYYALGHAFPDFFPVGMSYFPGSGAWHPRTLPAACHELFLFYRDALRAVWCGAAGRARGLPEFLLGLTDWNTRACDGAQGDEIPCGGDSLEGKLRSAWWQILAQIPTASPATLSLGMLWEHGEFYLPIGCQDAGDDFSRSFYLLFRQSWRARVCSRCKLLFVARRPKQIFCGTVCSAGSRLASKRKWWKRVGAKRRAGQSEEGSNGNRPERKLR